MAEIYRESTNMPKVENIEINVEKSAPSAVSGLRSLLSGGFGGRCAVLV